MITIEEGVVNEADPLYGEISEIIDGVDGKKGENLIMR